jgi:hypothetical protein
LESKGADLSAGGQVMSVQDLFENQSPEEIEELFDTWGQRGFEDTPSDTFFATLKGQPPFNPVYFPEGILQGYEFSPEFIADARKELRAGFGEDPE